MAACWKLPDPEPMNGWASTMRHPTRQMSERPLVVALVTRWRAASGARAK